MVIGYIDSEKHQNCTYLRKLGGYEISVVTGIDEAKGINLSVTAYPNPTTDYLTLEV
jgi:hypothetical protein